jgi:uncharacterized protein YecE (DUF72 family)
LTILAGTCGWSYQQWVGAFYPNNRVAKLPFYSRIFNSVEVDSSFYRPPSKSMIAGWISTTGPDFKFSLKIPKTITHDRRLVGIEKGLSDFVELVQPFVKASKMGCMLAQLPPTFAFKEMNNLESFFKLLPRNMHFAVEFRHESWDKEETWDLLKKYNVASTVADSPIEFLTRPVATATTHSYIRWHGRGRPTLYDYTYSEQELRPWLGKLEGMEKKVPVVYAYFNNTGAPINLLQMLDMRGEMTDAQKKAKARAERHSRKMAVKKITDF